MKKFYYMMLVVFASMMMTSCHDGDVERSINLSGSWNGNLNMFYGYDSHGYYHEFDASYSDIVFYPDYDYATHGYGKQVDWYDDDFCLECQRHHPGLYKRQYYHFDWEIHNGVIYLDYPSNPELNTAIYDYRMDRDYFSGYFEGSKYKFRLRKIADYYDWSCYHDNYMSWGWDDPYWKPETRSAEADEDQGTTEVTVVKRGRRVVE